MPSGPEGTALRPDDPYVTAAARELEMTMILRVWVEDGVLHIANPYETAEVPAPGYGKTDTLPRGSHQPAQLTEGQPPSPGGSVPPQGPAPTTGPGPEPPTNSPPPGEGQGEGKREGSGLDDFTAIEGVGPVTAQKLHDLGLFTYQDLRNWSQALEDHPDINTRTLTKIQAWLDQRLM